MAPARSTAWTNATSLAEPTNFGYAELSLASADPTGNQTVAAATVTGYGEGGLLAIVLRPASALPFDPTYQDWPLRSGNPKIMRPSR
jgi:hypothetical protein